MSFVKKAFKGLLGLGGQQQGADLAASTAQQPDIPDPNTSPEAATQIAQARQTAVARARQGRTATVLTGAGGGGLPTTLPTPATGGTAAALQKPRKVK